MLTSYIQLFLDLDEAGKYAWGVAALAFLCYSLSKVVDMDTCFSGSTTLLQVILLQIRSVKRMRCADYYIPDCVLRQFGKSQVISVGPPKWERRERGAIHPTSWGDELASEISDWRQRDHNVVNAATNKYGGIPTKDYMAWYSMFTHRYGNTPLCPPSQSQSNVPPSQAMMTRGD
ncbi:hypothetical protein AMTR_s00145p00065650 [Amborella trichopoda]|uniref:Aminotransferase-like plant mobile domain-containing protein n=1 Tax=Amborella trichopoda TaxID=13333 RepID=W1P7T8_AMBTC|nr:hypothetical protein AMTR_s00145p00065650 [Amborella trichopoda]